jgi:hypothetical protein
MKRKRPVSPDRVSTTIKINRDQYKGFKILALDYNICLQDLVERSVSLYIINKPFREIINEHIPDILSTFNSSGSALTNNSGSVSQII